MKKIVLSIAITAITTFYADAQVIRLYKGNSLVTTYTQFQIDRIVFEEGTTSTGSFNGHEYVDLGLKDEQGRTIYWATCNIGAESPEDCGDYFAWGETEPYYEAGHSQDSPCSSWRDGKTGYNWESYQWCNGTENSMTKYCANIYQGIVDGKIVLDPEDDAATQNWGDNWRMPTKEELDLLRTSCTWTWNDEWQGYTVIGSNGNSIFLPTTGFRGGQTLAFVSSGYYWSSSLKIVDSNYGHCQSFKFGFISQNSSSMRCLANPVRAVCVFDVEDEIE